MHGKALPSVMGELASKLIDEFWLVVSITSVFFEFKYVESSNNRFAKLKKAIIWLSGSQNQVP